MRSINVAELLNQYQNKYMLQIRRKELATKPSEC